MSPLNAVNFFLLTADLPDWLEKLNQEMKRSGTHRPGCCPP
jgi:hypothetical protein